MRTLALFVIGLVFGGGIGFVTAAGMGVSFDGHDHDDAAQHGDDADHAIAHETPIEVDPPNAPDLSIDLTHDPMAGYNLHVIVDNFAFSPQQASRAHVEGQGHAHVYVNDMNQGRLFGPWAHLDHLPKGEVTVKVTLNANDHSPLAKAGEPIAASTTLVVE